MKQLPWFQPIGKHAINGHIVKGDHRLTGWTFWQWASTAITDINVIEADFGNGETYYSPVFVLWRKLEIHKASGCMILRQTDEEKKLDPEYSLCYGNWDLQEVPMDKLRENLIQEESVRIAFVDEADVGVIRNLLNDMATCMRFGIELADSEGSLGGRTMFRLLTEDKAFEAGYHSAREPQKLTPILNRLEKAVNEFCEKGGPVPLTAPIISYRRSIWEILGDDQ